MTCSCYACTVAAVRDHPVHDVDKVFGQDPRMIRMFCCPKCGHKRCPHATDHQYTCTNSNEFGQPGSNYKAFPYPPREDDAKWDRK